MAITYQAGRRLQATSTDFGTDGAGIPAVATQGGWKEIARTTLGSASSSLANLGFDDKEYYMFLIDEKGQNGAATNNFFRNGSGGVIDTGSNYASRQNSNNTGYSNSTNNSNVLCPISSANPVFHVHYGCNLAGQEKLFTGSKIDLITTGLSNPYRKTFTWKHAQTSSPLDSFELNTGGSNTYNSGSELVVLGWDPEDNHTTNFWEELDDVSWSSGGTISSNTFTAKKYLWVQGWYTTDNTNGNVRMTFNGDNTSSYAMRYNTGGGSDEVVNSSTYLYVQVGGDQNNTVFFNYFIINNASAEKLIIGRNNLNNTAGAGNIPIRNESAYKYTGTAQITSLSIARSSGSYGSGQIKVWGSN